MNRLQPVNFNSIGEFLDYLPEEELIILQSLRNIILDTLLDGKEKLAYNVPFYYRHARICYLWPASVPWGGINQGVSIGFCKGSRLSDPAGFLNKGNRKEVCTRNFTSTGEIDPDLLRSYLFEAIELDEKLHG